MKKRNLWNILTIASMSLAMTAALSAGACAQEAVVIEVSDESIQVDGKEIAIDESASVYAGAEIVYYKAGQGVAYGEGDESDAHTEEEAAAHTVITITQPGTYKITGSISKGQIAVDLGEESREDSSAVVNLILDNVDITCDVAPGIIVFNAYECGSDDMETATKDVDTTGAGFNLILADGSNNIVNGSHVAKIYKDGTTEEQVAADEAKKKWKFDGAIDSLVSMNINGEENNTGKLHVFADNEGISSALHMTINGGEVIINSSDDAMNTSEDYVSVLTVNGGILTCDSDMGNEGDGIDSNGWIVMNGGYVTTGANPSSMDSGIDADLGIYTNGGTLLAGGNMYDEVEIESMQPFMVFSFAQQLVEGEIILIKDREGNPVTAFSPVNDCQTVVYSCDSIKDGDYTLYKVSSLTGDLNGSIYTNITDYTEEVQLQYGSSFAGGFGGEQMPEKFDPARKGEIPGGFDPSQTGEMPGGFDPSQMDEMPEDFEPGKMPPGGGRPGRGQMFDKQGQNGEGNTIFTVNGMSNLFAQIGAVLSE